MRIIASDERGSLILSSIVPNRSLRSADSAASLTSGVLPNVRDASAESPGYEPTLLAVSYVEPPDPHCDRSTTLDAEL